MMVFSFLGIVYACFLYLSEPRSQQKRVFCSLHLEQNLLTLQDALDSDPLRSCPVKETESWGIELTFLMCVLVQAVLFLLTGLISAPPIYPYLSLGKLPCLSLILTETTPAQPKWLFLRKAFPTFYILR